MTSNKPKFGIVTKKGRANKYSGWDFYAFGCWLGIINVPARQFGLNLYDGTCVWLYHGFGRWHLGRFPR